MKVNFWDVFDELLLFFDIAISKTENKATFSRDGFCKPRRKEKLWK